MRATYHRNADSFKATFAAWAKANPEKIANYAARKRAKRKAVETVRFERQSIFERDGYLCWLCELPTDPDSDTKWERPSIDHVVPLAHGGPHTPGNVRTAHLVCNVRRGAPVPA